MSTNFSAEPVLRELKSFQRNTVEHVIRRFFRDDDRTDRFLVADETGLGKTIVAKGVIARTIEELQDDPYVDAIDILYICSNTDLAQQNLRKLAVEAGRSHGIASRLTLLAKYMHRFRLEGTQGMRKQVNLISFTPGTSFSKGWFSGVAEERAMLYLMLEKAYAFDEGGLRARAGRLLQGGCATVESFLTQVGYLRDALRSLQGAPDPGITQAFLEALQEAGDGEASLGSSVSEYLDGSDTAGGGGWALVGDLRALLAKVSAERLTPDLVILDEFQRFRELLDPRSEAGELAHHLFNYRHGEGGHGAKVLMLSATPFKPFTYAEESAHDDHHQDFLKVVEFLCSGDAVQQQGVADALARYRTALVTGQGIESVTEDVQGALLRFMSRTERPRELVSAMSTANVTALEVPSAKEVEGFVAMHDLAREVRAPFNVEYWKSAPYFPNFMDSYKVGEKVREGLRDPAQTQRIKGLLGKTHHLDTARMKRLDSVPWGNGRLKTLAAETVEQGWWKLLWVPPAMPYLAPRAPFTAPLHSAMTKRVVFSSWTATPTAVAVLLSHEADRQPVAHLPVEQRDTDAASRLAYRVKEPKGTPERMSTLALFWPMPGPALLADPRRHRREAGQALTRAQLRSRVTKLLRLDPTTESSGRAWDALFVGGDTLPDGLGVRDVVESLSGAFVEADDVTEAGRGTPRSAENLRVHVEHAFELRATGHRPTLSQQGQLDAADLAANAPGNIAWRALRRIAHGHEAVTEQGLWRAAAGMASAFRVLFNRPGTVRLLDRLYKEGAYWKKVLTYCAAGNLQATMDEYLHHLHVAFGSQPINDALLAVLAQTAGEAITLRPSRLEYLDADSGDKEHTFVRFAQRYGGRRQNEESARQPQLREAFNSPFWPFVLATTSIGQEGVDFHRYSHSVFHWNIPANPVDFEQREGRVDRHAGHAVRKNVVKDFGQAALDSEAEDPWAEVYRLSRSKFYELGDFAPYWCYPGAAKVERRVTLYPLSNDGPRLDRANENVALYRLTFGQPRQEDMITLIAKRYTTLDEATLAGLRLDLSAPEPDVH